MATWKEVKTYLKNNYDVKKDEEGYVQLLQAFNDGRDQLVFVFQKEYKGAEWIEIASLIGTLRPSELNTALEIIDKRTCGGLTKIGDKHAIRHCMPIADLSNEEIDGPILLVAGVADSIEEKILGVDDL